MQQLVLSFLTDSYDAFMSVISALKTRYNFCTLTVLFTFLLLCAFACDSGPTLVFETKNTMSQNLWSEKKTMILESVGTNGLFQIPSCFHGIDFLKLYHKISLMLSSKSA